MIGKVAETAKNTGFSNTKNTNKFSAYTKHQVSHSNLVHDTSDFSSASQFLRRTNWRLKSINKNNEKLLALFSIDNINFEAEIPIKSLQFLTQIKYKIIKDYEYGKKILIDAGIYPPGKMNIQSEIDIDIPAIQKLFILLQRKEAGVSNSVNGIDLADSIINENAEKLESEFFEINSVLIAFIEKYEGISIKLINLENRTKVIQINSIQFLR